MLINFILIVARRFMRICFARFTVTSSDNALNNNSNKSSSVHCESETTTNKLNLGQVIIVYSVREKKNYNYSNIRFWYYSQSMYNTTQEIMLWGFHVYFGPCKWDIWESWEPRCTFISIAILFGTFFVSTFRILQCTHCKSNMTEKLLYSIAWMD